MQSSVSVSLLDCICTSGTIWASNWAQIDTQKWSVFIITLSFICLDMALVPLHGFLFVHLDLAVFFSGFSLCLVLFFCSVYFSPSFYLLACFSCVLSPHSSLSYSQFHFVRLTGFQVISPLLSQYTYRIAYWFHCSPLAPSTIFLHDYPVSSPNSMLISYFLL